MTTHVTWILLPNSTYRLTGEAFSKSLMKQECWTIIDSGTEIFAKVNIGRFNVRIQNPHHVHVYFYVPAIFITTNVDSVLQA